MLKRTALPIVLLLTFAACSSAGAGPSPSPSPGGAASPRPTPTAVPGQGATDGTGGGGTDPGAGGGGGSGGNAGTGILPPGITFPLPQHPDDALLGDAKYLEPVEGLVNPHPVNVQLVRAALADGKAFADLRWYSGVAPCNQLDSVDVARDDAAKTIHITVVEGSGPGDQMCIEIAELHAVAVDLGALASGSWTISAEGDAPAIALDVP